MLAFRKRFAIAKPCFPLLFPRERTTSVETVSQHKLLLNCRSVKVPPELFSFSSRCTIFHAKWWHHHHVNFTSRPSWQQGLVFPSSKLLPASPTQFPRLSLLSCSSANDDDREHDPYLCWWLSSLAILVSFDCFGWSKQIWLFQLVQTTPISLENPSFRNSEPRSVYILSERN